MAGKSVVAASEEQKHTYRSNILIKNGGLYPPASRSASMRASKASSSSPAARFHASPSNSARTGLLSLSLTKNTKNFSGSFARERIALLRDMLHRVHAAVDRRHELVRDRRGSRQRRGFATGRTPGARSSRALCRAYRRRAHPPAPGNRTCRRWCAGNPNHT